MRRCRYFFDIKHEKQTWGRVGEYGRGEEKERDVKKAQTAKGNL